MYIEIINFLKEIIQKILILRHFEFFLSDTIFSKLLIDQFLIVSNIPPIPVYIPVFITDFHSIILTNHRSPIFVMFRIVFGH